MRGEHRDANGCAWRSDNQQSGMTQAGATWRVAVAGEQTTAIWEPAPSSARPAVFVCAHGAGGHMSDRGLLAVSAVLRSQGVGVVRFNFLYREKGSGRPDPMPRLIDCLTAVVSRVRDELQPEVLIVGGRSMGGRAASMLAAGGLQLRRVAAARLSTASSGSAGEAARCASALDLQLPVLCINGTRDALCRRDLMDGVVARLGSNWTMHWLEGADHSFHVLKSSGTTDAAVLEDVGEVVSVWLTGLDSGRQLAATPNT